MGRGFGFARDSIWWQATHVIKDKAIEKALRFKDPQYSALLFVEFVLSIIVVAAILLWLDHRYNVVEFPFNVFLFAVVIYAVIHFYKYTELFRQEKALKRKSSVRIMLLEFTIFAIVLVAGYAYLDPKIDTMVYPYNVLLFLLVLLPVSYVYVNEKFIKPSFSFP